MLKKEKIEPDTIRQSSDFGLHASLLLSGSDSLNLQKHAESRLASGFIRVRSAWFIKSVCIVGKK
jgi:hypothetical protein